VVLAFVEEKLSKNIIIHPNMFEGCDSNVKVNIFYNLKVATNETTTLH